MKHRAHRPRAARTPHAGPRRSAPVRRGRLPRGFTLIEVLIALGIVAIALAAGAQATMALTRNAQRQSDVLLAALCGENALIQTRLSRQMPAIGDASSTCTQAGVRFDLTVSTAPTANLNFRRVDVQVRDDTAALVLQVATVVGRY